MVSLSAVLCISGQHHAFSNLRFLVDQIKATHILVFVAASAVACVYPLIGLSKTSCGAADWSPKEDSLGKEGR